MSTKEHIFAFIARAAQPSSSNEDAARREFILNVLLLGSLSLLTVACVSDTFNQVFDDEASYRADALGAYVLDCLLAFFAALYALSVKRYARLASALLLSAFYSLAAYMGLAWGVDVSASLLFYALMVIMAGILLSARWAFAAALLVSATITLTVYAHRVGFMSPNRVWTLHLWQVTDLLVASVIFLIIALVMWLSNREIEKSLRRARQSEADLKIERDQLEIRVEERTQDLRQAEFERMSQTYRFVEFGRMASGVFHDLMNPLAGLSLNIDRIAASTSKTVLADDVARAKRAASHMESLIASLRKHLKREEVLEEFSLHELLQETVRMFATHAQERGVSCVLESGRDARLYGDPVALMQVFMNLLGNAIQAYPVHYESSQLREVYLALTREGNQAIIRIRDAGEGIAPEILPHIFEPFFTTKGKDGIGLGLSLAHRIIEQGFNGTMIVESSPGNGTTFVLHLPIREP